MIVQNCNDIAESEHVYTTCIMDYHYNIFVIIIIDKNIPYNCLKEEIKNIVAFKLYSLHVAE